MEARWKAKTFNLFDNFHSIPHVDVNVTFFVGHLVGYNVGHHVGHLVGSLVYLQVSQFFHFVLGTMSAPLSATMSISTLCEVSETLTEWKSESITDDGRTDRGWC